jgi:hypothetical protein
MSLYSSRKCCRRLKLRPPLIYAQYNHHRFFYTEVYRYFVRKETRRDERRRDETRGDKQHDNDYNFLPSQSRLNVTRRCLLYTIVYRFFGREETRREEKRQTVRDKLQRRRQHEAHYYYNISLHYGRCFLSDPSGPHYDRAQYLAKAAEQGEFCIFSV